MLKCPYMRPFKSINVNVYFTFKYVLVLYNHRVVKRLSNRNLNGIFGAFLGCLWASVWRIGASLGIIYASLGVSLGASLGRL